MFLHHRRSIGFLCLFGLFLLLASAPHAQETQEGKDPIDIELEKASAGNTREMEEAVARAEKQWDKELNRVYQTLLKELPNSEKASLRASQKAWLAFRDADFRASKQVVRWRGKDGGTIWGGVYARHRMDTVRDRVLRLRDLGPLGN